MMKPDIFMSYGALVSPLGFDEEEHYQALLASKSGIQKQVDSGYNNEDWYISKIHLSKENRFDELLQLALGKLKERYSSDFLKDDKTLFILSSTKGNINKLPTDVFASARAIIRAATTNANPILVVSNACISGVIAINKAADYLTTNLYENVIVIGIDVVSDFVIYGFQSLFAMSDEPVKPYDQARKGISLGEACGIVVLSKKTTTTFSVLYRGGASSNDANHISGPSRTGEGLFRAIQESLKRANCTASAIDFLSAHGTGTLYNDEMESIAFERCGLQNTPVNSLKAYFGHTLGAAGVIETIISMLSIEKQQLFESKGFQKLGVSKNMNMITQTTSTNIQTILKTVSGFGGGNAALILQEIT